MATRSFLFPPCLVSRNRDSRNKSRSAAPGGQGATSENTGRIRARSNAAPRDAPPGTYAMNYGYGTLVGDTHLDLAGACRPGRFRVSPACSESSEVPR